MKSDLSNDLGADSLETVELTMALEQEFAIEIDDKEIRITKLGEIWKGNIAWEFAPQNSVKS